MGQPKTKVTQIYNTEDGQGDDEAATVVLDFNAIKKELAETKSDPKDVEIQFQVHKKSETAERTTTEAELSLMIDQENDESELDLDLGAQIAIKTVLFDFKGTHLKDLYSNFESEEFDFEVIDKLPLLNKLIKSESKLIVIFYYNQAPKSINSLMKQLNAKFSHVETLIIAKNLSSDKAALHQKSASGAKFYLSSPSDFNSVVEILKKF